MSFKTLIPYLFLVQICTAFAQNETDRVIEDLVEPLSETAGEDFDYSDLTDRLNYYSRNPLDLNKALPEQLYELTFLSPVQVRALLLYRDANGALISLLELQTIEGFDSETIRKLLPFITLDPTNPLADITTGKLLRKGVHNVMLRYGQVIEKQKGYTIPDTSAISHYAGSPQRLFVRYRYNYGQHISASLNMEKDAGEQFFSGKQSKGFDFYSGNIFIRNTGKFRRIAAGDYALQFGQGLTLWSGLGFGKGAAIATITKPDVGLRPYSSANEALFLRGLAATTDIGRFAFTPFISYRSLDAGSNGPADAGEITSLSQAGFHRTAAEIKNQDRLKQLIYGLNIQYSTIDFNAGIVGYQTSFDHTIESGGNLYDKFEFSGKSLVNAGLYYNRSWRNLYLFGEIAHSFSGGLAYINGLIGSLSPRVSLVLLQRNYQKDYQSFYSGSIGEGSKASNERGFYSGLTLTLLPKTELVVYTDFFRFPWLKFRVDAPSKGHEIYSQLTYTIKKKLTVGFRYKLEEKEQNDDRQNTVNVLESVEKQNYRAELDYAINDDIRLRNRVELVTYKKGEQAAEFGSMLLQDVIYNPMQSRFSGNIRFAVFDTSGFNSRIYAFENDVLYNYSVPAMQNRGLRFYINGRYTVRRGIDIWLKYSITRYSNIEEIGSGPDMIEGSKKSDIKMQLRFQF